ncbi:MAG: hypothetical protein Q9166_006711 [cf. Caloplaca sp. 2 TL-2023]
MAVTLPSDLAALVTSFTVYRLIHRYYEGPNPSLARLSAVIKATSTLHSSIASILAIYFIRHCQAQCPETGSQGADGPITESGSRLGEPISQWRETTGATGHGGVYPDDSTNPLLQIRSRLGNAITSIECGFLLQNTISLLREAQLRFRLSRPSSKSNLRSLLKHSDKTLLIHHVRIALALLVLHHYIRQGRERGIYIIVQFLLMNSSTPFLNMRWWLRTYHPGSTILCLGSDLAFIAAFYVARIWLVGWIIREYGKSHGYDSAWKVYMEGMRVPCQMGTGALWVANTAWWVLLVTSVVKRLPRDLARINKAMRTQKD